MSSLSVILVISSAEISHILAEYDETVKFVDDTMHSLGKYFKRSASHLPAATVSSCSEWSLVNKMIKIKCIKDQKIACLLLEPHSNGIVSETKLLGVVTSDDLKRDRHIDYICKKTAKPGLYGLRLLKRNALPADVLILFYCMHIRSIVEYAC
jgi:hypothetical protein